ncbi:MAG TPA: alcohol dehydrogenase catalytic domain-containing protein [Conexibacter sp.]|nr:alcohol dehydrogenase catalytic domain-containing protein [Conexibacter sp.]
MSAVASATMRAAVYHGPGDVRIEQRARPAAPAAGELLLDVARVALCGSDAAEWDHGPVLVPLHVRHGGSGHVGPVVLGHEFVGRVAAVGDGVEGFAVGDRVVSGAGISCGRCARCRERRTNLCERYHTLGFHLDGGLAEQVLAPVATCVAVPDGCEDDAAALAQPLAVALHALNRGSLARSETLVVHGAGGIGAFAIAGAAARGVQRIVAIDVDAGRLETARALGASATLDARTDDVRAAVRELTGGAGADVVLETSGVAHAPALAIELARAGGRVVIVGLQPRPVALNLLDVALREVELRSALAHVCATDIPEALAVLADGRVAAQVVDRVIALGDVVERGLAPLARRQVSGKVLVDPTA